MICGEFANHTIASVAGPLPIFCHSLSSFCLLTEIDVHAAQPQIWEPQVFARFLSSTWNHILILDSSKSEVYRPIMILIVIRYRLYFVWVFCNQTAATLHWRQHISCTFNMVACINKERMLSSLFLVLEYLSCKSPVRVFQKTYYITC